MELRQALLPPKLDETKVEALAHLADEIIDYMDTGRNYRPLVEQFNRLAARSYDIIDFDGAAGSMNMQDFVKLALTPDPPFVPDMTREEQLEIIRRWGFSEYGAYEVREIGYWYEILRRNLGVPQLSFDENVTPEEILQKALSYKPIAL